MTPLRRREAHHVKRGTITHPKFLHLCALLGEEDVLVCGRMEVMWQFTAQYAQDGAIGKWTDAAIAQAMRWRKDAAELIQHLVTAGWLDEHPTHRLVVHDWHEHADDAVHSALARARKFFANGHPPKTRRLRGAELADAKAFDEAPGDQERSVGTETASPAPTEREVSAHGVRRQSAHGTTHDPPHETAHGGRVAPPRPAPPPREERERGADSGTEGEPPRAAALSAGRLREVSSPVVPGRAAGLAAVWRECRVAFDPECPEADDGWWRDRGEPAAFKAFLPLVSKRSPGVLEPAMRWAFTSPPNPANNWPGWGAQLDEPLKFASKVGIIVKQWEAADRAAKDAKPPAPPPRAADPLFKSWGELGWNHRYGRITDEQLEHQRGLMRAAGIKQDQDDLAKWAKEPPPVKGGLEQALRHRATA